MLDQNDIDYINAAIDMAIASNKRASNSARQPHFKQLYQQEIDLYNAIKLKLKNLNNKK